MDFVAVIAVEMVYAVAFLILISAGLAIVFGMMRVINLAHGEFLMMGGYATIVAVGQGINVFVAMFIISPLVVGLIGLAIERLVISRLYGRLIDSMLATWGLSLFLIGLASMIFGNTTTSISNPISGFTVGDYQINGYNYFIIVVVAVLMISIYFTLKVTRVGLIVRGTMQNPNTSSALGYNHKRVYMLTFFVGSALAGFAGGVIAPLVGLVPTSGGIYIAKAFITVISGGASIIVGLLSSSLLLGVVNQVFSFLISPVIGEVALLFAAVILLRLLPEGITGRFFRDKM